MSTSIIDHCENCDRTTTLNDYGYCADCEASFALPLSPDELRNREYILALARSFPCLRSKLSHVTPETWDVDKFVASSAPWSTGETLCALFVANVWNPGWAKEQGWTFDLMRFLGNADTGNRTAFVNWCAKPYWP